MSKFYAALEYVRDNPNASYDEITNAVGVSYDVAKEYVARLKRRGYLEKKGRTYTVLKEPPASKSPYKQDIIKEMIESYMDDFRSNKAIGEKIRLGELIIRLVEKL